MDKQIIDNAADAMAGNVEKDIIQAIICVLEERGIVKSGDLGNVVQECRDRVFEKIEEEKKLR